jgi:hypothetical protein
MNIKLEKEARTYLCFEGYWSKYFVKMVIALQEKC